MLDIPFARKVLEFAQTKHPDFMHDQNVVLVRNHTVGCCNTVGCIAGIATMLSPECEDLGYWDPQTGEAFGQHKFLVNGQRMNWVEAGKTLLGLTDHQATMLFFCRSEQAAVSKLESYIKQAEM